MSLVEHHGASWSLVAQQLAARILRMMPRRDPSLVTDVIGDPSMLVRQFQQTHSTGGFT